MSQGYTKGAAIDTDGTLSADSDFLIPSQKAVKTYVDTEINDLLYTYPIVQYGANLPGATTAYISGSSFLPVAVGSQDRIAVLVKENILITEALLLLGTTGTIGSAENISIYIRVNNATDYLIATVGAATAQREFYNNSLNGGAGIALGPGDRWVIKIETPNPSWATAPIQTNSQGYIKYKKT
jgi:hypothetical protein